MADLPKLPKLLDVRGLDQAQAPLADRVWEWVSSAQDLLAALRAANQTLTTAITTTAAAAVPTGAAGGELGGTYPNPTVNHGTTAVTACAGNDSRLSDSRAPTGAASGDLGGSYPSPTVAALHETSGPTQLTLGSVTDGQFLKRSGATLIGGNSGLTTNVWSPFVPPAAPSTWDDEFPGTSINGKWTEWDVAGTLTVSVANHLLQLLQTNSATSRLGGVYQAIPGTSEYSISAQCCDWGGLSSLRHTMGIFLAQDLVNPSTADVRYFCMNVQPGGTMNLTLFAMSDYQTITATTTLITGLGPTAAFLRIRVNGTNYMLDWSADGYGWRNILGSTAIGITPVHFGLASSNADAVANNAVGLSQLFRVLSGTGTSSLYGGQLGGLI